MKPSTPGLPCWIYWLSVIKNKTQEPPIHLREKCQKTLIKRNNSAVDPSSDDPDEKTLMKRNNSIECLLNYARRLILSQNKTHKKLYYEPIQNIMFDNFV